MKSIRFASSSNIVLSRRLTLSMLMWANSSLHYAMRHRRAKPDTENGIAHRFRRPDCAATRPRFQARHGCFATCRPDAGATAARAELPAFRSAAVLRPLTEAGLDAR